MALLKASLEDNAAGIRGSLDAITDVKVQRGIDQHMLEQKGHLDNLRFTIEQRLYSIESNIDLIAIILKRVDEKLLSNSQDSPSNTFAEGVRLPDVGTAQIIHNDLESITSGTSTTMNSMASLSSCIHVDKNTFQFHGIANLARTSSTCPPIAEEDF